MGIVSKVILNGAKNSVIQITGEGFGTPDVDILDTTTLGEHKGSRLDAIVYAFEAKTSGLLRWLDPDGQETVLPLEGRGKMDFEALQSLTVKKDSMIKLTPSGAGVFFLLLNMTKS